ncbi:hypothetical protein IQ266_26850 [filamentous cyanobacterium LEGE 11480]|uniref:Uncharacterized protein n=1 Tax=Romeriopsis navalis LEGE 11480 TaxID=2777977 RepID=A0A928VRE7_9CYAN|nr:hypothetical protein [Romeriopsis navalis LEGE 11480]
MLLRRIGRGHLPVGRAFFQLTCPRLLPVLMMFRRLRRPALISLIEIDRMILNHLIFLAVMHLAGVWKR